MFEKLARSAALGVVAAAAGAAAVGVGAFALYAALKDPLGQAGAAAVVALLFLLVALGAVMALRSGSGEKKVDKPATAEPGASQLTVLRDKAITIASQRPVVAGVVGVVGALFLLRNPALISALVGAALGRAEGRFESRRGGWF